MINSEGILLRDQDRYSSSFPSQALGPPVKKKIRISWLFVRVNHAQKIKGAVKPIAPYVKRNPRKCHQVSAVVDWRKE